MLWCARSSYMLARRAARGAAFGRFSRGIFHLLHFYGRSLVK